MKVTQPTASSRKYLALYAAKHKQLEQECFVPTDALEKVIRPIVEGQLRGFIKEHPEILDGVTWYKGEKQDRAATFVNSIAKRIIRDLLCSNSRARMAAALLQGRSDSTPKPAVALGDAAGQPAHGTATVRGLRRLLFGWVS